VTVIVFKKERRKGYKKKKTVHRLQYLTRNIIEGIHASELKNLRKKANQKKAAKPAAKKAEVKAEAPKKRLEAKVAEDW